MGIDKDYTTEDMRDLSVEKLHDIMASCQKPGYYQMAVEELQRRFLREIATQAGNLAESSRRMEAVTEKLNGSVISMDTSVRTLADSSDKMERLTRWIMWLTVALLLLTVLQVVALLRDQFSRTDNAPNTAPAMKQVEPGTQPSVSQK